MLVSVVSFCLYLFYHPYHPLPFLPPEIPHINLAPSFTTVHLSRDFPFRPTPCRQPSPNGAVGAYHCPLGYCQSSSLPGPAGASCPARLVFQLAEVAVPRAPLPEKSCQPNKLQLVRGARALQRVLDSGSEGSLIDPELEGRHDIFDGGGLCFHQRVGSCTSGVAHPIHPSQ